jgi:hypothetical protein
MTADETIEHLESAARRLNRRVRVTYIFIPLLAFAIVWLSPGLLGSKRADAQLLGTPKVLEAREFRLVDNRGELRAWLALSDKLGPTLCLCNEDGKPRLILGVDKTGPGIRLLSESDHVGTGLAVDEGGPELGLLDGRGKVRARLRVDKGGPALLFFDEDEKPIWKAPR